MDKNPSILILSLPWQVQFLSLVEKSCSVTDIVGIAGHTDLLPVD
ncbi:UNVERIFIED_ORG: hypothetical protein M2414_004881 [Rahnella aquatilis]